MYDARNRTEVWMRNANPPKYFKQCMALENATISAIQLIVLSPAIFIDMDINEPISNLGKLMHCTHRIR